MTGAARCVLKAAARTPGVRLLDLNRRGPHGQVRCPYAYGTLRRAAAGLREEGLLYSARPATILLAPKWGRLTLEARAALNEDPITAAVLAAHGQLQPDVLLVADFLGVTEGTVMQRIVHLRDQRILHPWDGLVLTPAGYNVARQEGCRPRLQTPEGEGP